MNNNLISVIMPAVMLAQSPIAVPVQPQYPDKKILIIPLSLPLNNTEVSEAFDCLTKALPNWKISPASNADRREIPKTRIALRCKVSTEAGPEDWEFLFERNKAGKMQLRAARILD